MNISELKQFLESENAQEVLQLMIFTTAPIAHLMTKTGTPIKMKVEVEQAVVLSWLLLIVAEFGSDWRREAAKKIAEMQAKLPKEVSTQTS